MSIPSIFDVRPYFQEHAFTASAAISGVASPTRLSSQTGIDLGSVGASANSAQRGLTIQFESAFDDSVFEETRAWIMNLPGFASHKFVIAAASGQSFTAGAATAIITGIDHPGNPYQAAKWTSSYDSPSKRIRALLLQLQIGAAPALHNQALSMLTNPVLVVEFQRRNSTITSLPTNQQMFDSLGEGELFTFSDVSIYEVRTNPADLTKEMWQYWGAVREETVQPNWGTDRVDWVKGKPTVTFHQALARIMSEVSFQLADPGPYLLAKAWDTNATTNEANNTVEISLNAVTRPTIKSHFVFEWRTQGGFIVRARYPKATMTIQGYTPGASNFAELPITLTGLATGINREACLLAFTQTPSEQIFLPLTYTVA
jgi:hypothetical protein